MTKISWDRFSNRRHGTRVKTSCRASFEAPQPQTCRYKGAVTDSSAFPAVPSLWSFVFGVVVLKCVWKGRERQGSRLTAFRPSDRQAIATSQMLDIPSILCQMVWVDLHFFKRPRGLTFTWWGCYGLCFRHKLSELVQSFLFCSYVCLCLYGPFNCISFHKFSRQFSAFSLCSASLISVSLDLSTICLCMKASSSPDIILCGWLGLKHQLTNLCQNQSVQTYGRLDW